jgi:hypothetical protein
MHFGFRNKPVVETQQLSSQFEITATGPPLGNGTLGVGIELVIISGGSEVRRK